jgi:hypothetical protein
MKLFEVIKMSQQQSQVETDAPVSEGVLREQIDKCNEKVKEIIEDRIDVADEDDIYRKIDGYLGNVEGATLDCFTDRNQTSTLFDQMKWLLRALIEERGYEDKLVRDNGDLQDNPVKLTYWFKLYASVGLNEKIEIENMDGIERLNKYREDTISHPRTLPSPEGGTDPVLLSSLLLIWYAIEELVDLWGRLLDEDNLETRLELLRDDHEFQIGFVADLRGDHGYITSYQKGESGKSTRIEPRHVSFFPSEGDIVQFESEQRQRRDGSDHSALTPVETGCVGPFR